MAKNKRMIGLLALVALAGLVLLVRWGTGGPSQAVLPQVTVAIATRQPWVDELEALGTARANESLDITSNVTETISEIHFKDGQQVEAGAPIVSLARGEEAAELAAAHAQLEEQKRELRRMRPLLRTKAIAQRTYDERKTAVEVAERTVQQVKARVSDRVITAPFAGVLGLRNVSVGSLVSPGDLITTLDDVDVIKLDFTMPATYLTSVKVGGSITARSPSFPDRAFEGKVTTLDSRIDPETRSLIVRVMLANADQVLRPGMLMYVTLENNQRESLTLPEEALLPKGEKVFVYVVGAEGKVTERAITIGARRAGSVEITSGLEGQERVIIRGQNKVRPGQTVAASEADGVSEKENQ